ncbi:hypothetical protein IHQ68_13000 [Chelatococcus sambhunathii]|uniref:Ca2+-binding protein, RTX toxin-related n=1 Tax=Chelatococcus sambhunathii TaxID=363953 RepID=A0ABU1DI05_9HYPH|nr:calcium-binding protein [Chelatococcus sambhunathii]MDR4307535.1 hypothetical protein [Chelatococcus sambhunathii]
MAVTTTYSLQTIEEDIVPTGVNTAGPEYGTTVLALDNGGLALAYEESSGDHLIFYDEKFDGIVEVDVDFDYGFQELTQLSNGNVLVSGADADGSRAYIFTETGTAVGDPNGLSLAGGSIAELQAGGFATAYKASDALFVQRYDAAGGEAGAPVQIGAGLTDTGIFDATALSDGGYVVSYWSDQATAGSATLRATVFNADGTIRVADVVLASGQQDAHLGSVAALADGGFAVTLETGEQNEYGEDVTLRLFDGDAANQTPGSVIHIDGRVDTKEFNPDVTVLDNGYVLVSWQALSSEPGPPDDEGNPTDEFRSDDILAALYDQAGNLVKGPIDLANDWMGVEQQPSVSALRGGSFAFGYSHYGYLYENPELPDYEDVKASILSFVRSSVGDGADDHIVGDELRDSMTGAGGADFLSGGGAADTIRGGAGADSIYGGAGADSMEGGAGDDVFNVDDAGDVVSEANGGGTDLVKSSVSFGLTGGYIENLTLTGDAAINATGNALANVLIGNAAANVLDGGHRADTMNGRSGDDTYYVNDPGDVVIDPAGGGVDRVISTVSFSLAGSYADNLSLVGGGAIDGTGNRLASVITGNHSANRLDGGAGNDRLSGGGGEDVFRFTAAPGAANADHIADFVVGMDKIELLSRFFPRIDLGELAQSAFKDLSLGAADADDRVIYDRATGRLFYDPDGSSPGARSLFAILDNKAAIDADDFIVV